jgi:hypothetical protein
MISSFLKLSEISLQRTANSLGERTSESFAREKEGKTQALPTELEVKRLVILKKVFATSAGTLCGFA